MKKTEIFYNNVIPKVLNSKVKISLTNEFQLLQERRISKGLEKGKNRFFFIFLLILSTVLFIIYNLYSITSIKKSQNYLTNSQNLPSKRGIIVDRNEKIISATISTKDLYLDPKKIIDKQKSIKSLSLIFPQKGKNYFKNILNKKRYLLIERHISLEKSNKIKAIGEPGLIFQVSKKRVYPHNNLFSHITGFLSKFEIPQSKLEKNFDEVLSKGLKLNLTVDVKIQNILYEEIQKGKDQFSAKAAAGILMNVNNGEILSMLSLPDFNPNHPGKIKPFTESNLITNARYEMGSTLKMFNAAMAFENNSISTEYLFDISEGYPLTKTKTVFDEFPMKEPVDFDTIFTKSSNVGSIKVLEKTGIKKQRIFFNLLGFNNQTKIEGLNSISNSLPSLKDWNDVASKTISYGYGLSITPISLVTKFASLVNGGHKIEPKIIKEQKVIKKQIIKNETSKKINKLLHKIVENGTGKQAKVKGISIGGKTGTANKSKNKTGYFQDKIITSFIGTFPVENPKYLLFILYDEPNNIEKKYYGGNTAAPVFAKIIKRITPILKISKENNLKDNYFLTKSSKN